MTVLTGKRILVVEDEFLVAAMIVDMLTELGAEIVGPASTIAKGIELAETSDIDAGLLDINVRGNRIDPVVAVLEARGIPFVFGTGYRDAVAGSQAPMLEKPYTQSALAAAMAKALGS